MGVISPENADNMSLLYSGTVAFVKPSTGRGNWLGQETYSFEPACVEFPARWDLNATTVESEKIMNLSKNCQRDTKKIPDEYAIVNKYTHDTSCDVEKSEPVASEAEQYVDTRSTKAELQNGKPPPSSSKSFCQYSGEFRAISNVLQNENLRNSRATVVSHSHLRMRREREPSRISYRMVSRLFKRRQTRKAVKSYISKYVPKA